jgi:hypothetical protein
MSSRLSKTKTKNPLPTRWLMMPSFTRGLQFLYTHTFTDLGEGHKPVNFPMSPLLAKLGADLQVSSAGRSIEGMLSSFLTNFWCESEAGRLLHAATRFLKSSNSGGRGGGGALGPPLGSMARGHMERGSTSERARNLNFSSIINNSLLKYEYVNN